ncbi:MAG: hypothetical protein ACTSRK_07900 [Promethearchaeota archaeon]
MSQKIPDNSAFPPIFCPTCGNQVESELVDDLSQGITIFCAACGHKFDYQAHKHRLNSKAISSVNLQTKSRTSHQKSSRSQPLDYRIQSQSVSSKHTSRSNLNTNILGDEQAKAKEYRQFRAIQKKNRKDFRHVKKTNKNRFKNPQRKMKSDYSILQKRHKKNYLETKNENDRTYQISLLSNVVTNPAELSNIKRNYSRIKRKNKREYVRIRRKYASSYKRVRKTNRATFRKARKVNRQKFHKNNEANQGLWQQYSLTLNSQYLNFGSFEPTYISIEDFRVFDPTIFASMDSEKFKQSETTKTATFSEISPSTSKIYGQPNIRIPKKVAKFDPMTGKPLPSTSRPIAKFDTLTGKPLQTPEAPESPEAPTQKELDKTKLSPIPEKMPRSYQSKEIPETPPAIVEKEEETFGNLQEIYTVLDEDVREGLLNLPISDEDRDMIAKSFIYLNISQQIKYLKELSAVNIADLETRKELIHVIRNLPIPKPQKEFLVEQLQYLNEIEQDNFVDTLERSQDEEDTQSDQPVQEEDNTQSAPQEEIEIPEEVIPEKAKEEDPETLKLQEERNKLLQMKEEKRKEEKLHQQALEKQKLEEERLERVKNLKEKIKQSQKTEDTKGKSSPKKKKRKTLEK